MRVRAAQNLGVHHARQVEIGRIERRAGDALLGVDARQPLADDLEIAGAVAWLGEAAIFFTAPVTPRRRPRWLRRSCRSRCTGTGCRQWRGGCPRPSASGSGRGVPLPTARCPACRSRTACRRDRREPVGSDAAFRPTTGPRWDDDVPARSLQRQYQAGVDRRAVHQHRAGPAVAVAAPFLGAGQVQPVAQQLEQGVARVGEHRVLRAVDRAGDKGLHGVATSMSSCRQQSASARAVSTATSVRR